MNHAYTLIGTAQYNGEKLVQIRNPWGSEAYKGVWSDDDSSKWTPEAKAALNHVTTKNDGIFYMPISNYRKQFSTASIALYQNWQRTQKQLSWDRSKELSSLSITINNPQAQRVVVGITGLQSRMFRDPKCQSS